MSDFNIYKWLGTEDLKPQYQANNNETAKIMYKMLDFLDMA